MQDTAIPDVEVRQKFQEVVATGNDQEITVPDDDGQRRRLLRALDGTVGLPPGHAARMFSDVQHRGANFAGARSEAHRAMMLYADPTPNGGVKFLMTTRHFRPSPN